MVVGRTDSVQTVQHAAFLASEGWTVWLAETDANGGDPSASSAVRVLAARRTAASSGPVVDRSRRAVACGAARVRLAFARTAVPLSGAVHALTDGIDAPRIGRRAGRTDVVALQASGLASGSVAAWLARQVEANDAQIVASFASSGSAPLVDAALRALGRTGLAHVLVDDGEAEPNRSEWQPTERFPTVCGLLAERPPGARESNCDHACTFPVAQVATLGGGWPLRAPDADGRPRRTRVVVDCQPGEDRLAFAVLRGVERAADVLRDGVVEVVGPSDDVRLAARLLAARTGLDVVLLDRFPRDRLTEPAAFVVAVTGCARMPAALVECMVAGGVPIGTAQSMRGWIRHEENGLAVPTEDPDALACALARAVGDGSLRRRIAENNALLVERWLTRDAVAPEILGLYETAARQAERR